ncbi:PrsW family intramembrane metalloprotease [Deinococcus pimensis]|uniref:PrsW family intramembrane metalloprotease n=1 Tax=Deinococcus pimensis TaxID=309888 RepID=UPI0004BAE80D|nr:PrsW family glutamic-type intramembrane protease [Deinococcus pimensis]
MSFTVLLAVTLLPAAFWFWLFARRDIHPEPAWLLWRTFGYGALAWLLSAALELSFNAVPVAWVVVVLTALVEEGAKLLAASTAVRERDFDEPVDGLVYAVTAALAFALFENLAYGLQYGVGVAVWRGSFTMLAHALFSVPIGYALARAHFTRERWWRTRGLLLSAALHAGFNGLLHGVEQWWMLPILALVLFALYRIADRLYQRLAPLKDMSSEQGTR